MLIDWFTVCAQVINFLILVWLLRRYLYKPVLAAIDAREQKIAAKIRDAEAQETKAKAAGEELRKRNEAFDQERDGLMRKATDAAAAERQRLIASARQDSDLLRARLAQALGAERAELGRQLSVRTQAEVFALTRKALSELAGTGLEDRMVEVVIERLRALPQSQEMAAAAQVAVVRSADDASPGRRTKLEASIREHLGATAVVRFETAPELYVGSRYLWRDRSSPGVSRTIFRTSPGTRLPSRRRSWRRRPRHRHMPSDTLLADLERTFDGLRQAREAFVPNLTLREIGTITSVSTGIATVSGLRGVGFEELIQFPRGLSGIAFNLDDDEIGVVLLGDYADLRAGDEVTRTGRVMDVGVGEALLGRVIDPLGRPLDDLGPPACLQRLPIEREAKAIMDRAPVTVPLQTGIKVIDALVPIGRGQRELILGDRQTGKSAIALDTILNQRDENVICIYVAMGQRSSAVAKAVADLRSHGAMPYTVVMVSEGSDAPGLTYIAPYAATSIAEQFMEAGSRCAGGVRRSDPNTRARIARSLCCCVVPPVGKHSPEISSISIRACSSAPRACAKSLEAAPSPPCPSSKLRPRTLRPTFRPISFRSRMVSFICHPRCSSLGSCRRSTSPNPSPGRQCCAARTLPRSCRKTEARVFPVRGTGGLFAVRHAPR